MYQMIRGHGHDARRPDARGADLKEDAMHKRSSPYRPRVLLVEDESLLALDMALTLQSGGYEVLGPCRSSADATEAVAELHPDVAVLDVNLGGGDDSFALCDVLEKADIPFVFVTGLSARTHPLPPHLADRPRLSKPVENDRLARELEAAIAADAPDGPGAVEAPAPAG
jgi:CheY-like chemotaxis protein